MQRKLAAFMTTAALTMAALVTAPASLLADENGNQFDPYELSEKDWFYSESNRLEDTKACWKKSKPPRLEAKINGKWTQVATPKKLIRDAACPGAYPYTAIYRVNPKKVGFSLGSSVNKTMRLRSIGKSGSQDKVNFARTVWKSESARNKQISKALGTFADALEDVLCGSLCDSSTPTPTTGWSGCYFNGQKMWGRVKVVEFGSADFDVYVTNFLPDLKVKSTEFNPSSCGEWKFVDFGPADFTIKYVNSPSWADFSVQYVSFFPGR